VGFIFQTKIVLKPNSYIITLTSDFNEKIEEEDIGEDIGIKIIDWTKYFI